jgi:hypothetical protein
VAGAVGARNSQQAQADAANKAANARYKHQLQIREHDWLQTRQTWEVKKHEFAQGIQLDHEKAWTAYQQNQEVLNQKITQAMFQQQDSAVKYGKAQGKAAMFNDNSGRLVNEQIAAFGRENAQRAQMMTDATYATMSSNMNIQQQQKESAIKRRNNVSIAPVLGVAPPPPQQVAGPGNSGIFTSILGAGASIAGGIANNTAPQAYGFDNPGAYNGSSPSFTPPTGLPTFGDYSGLNTTPYTTPLTYTPFL